MTDVAIRAEPFTMQAARVLTDEVKADTAALWTKLLRLYEGDAHTALGFSSWADYYTEEFGESKSTGYRILDAARVVRELESHSPMGEQAPSERVAREIAPLLKEHPDAIPVVWGEVVQEHGPAPTAKQVKETVARHVGDPVPASAGTEAGPEYTSCPTCGHRVRADKPLRPRGEE